MSIVTTPSRLDPSGGHGAFAAGWYADPWGRAKSRYWSGSAWTRWISHGTETEEDPLPLRRILDRSDLPHLRFLDEVFLPEARGAGLLTPLGEVQLSSLRRRLEGEALGETVRAPEPGPVTAPEERVPLPAATRAVAPTMSASAPEATATVHPLRPGILPPAGARQRKPSWLARLFASTREAVATDLAANGLAYLGVLLVFVGSFGLVVFAFADVARSLRPLAELVIAVVPFVSGALLRRRGAVVVGQALEVGGGLLLPIMVITSFLDGFSIPPDPEGVALVVALSLSCGVVAAGFAAWVWRHPTSGLRFVVGPVAWLTVAMASLGVGRAIPSGNGVSVPGAAQMAVVAAALLVTLVTADRWRGSVLGSATLTAGMLGWAVIGGLSVLAWGAEGWPSMAITVSGVLMLLTLELLRDRLGDLAVGLVEPAWVAGVGLALVPDLGLGEAAALTVVVLVLVVERSAARHAPSWVVTIPSALAVVALLGTYEEPWWAVGTVAAATAWAVVRRLKPFDVPRAALALDVSAAVLPYGLVVALGLARDVGTATLAGAVLVLLATVPATRPLLHRDARDAVRWRLWWITASGAVVLVAAPGSVVALTTDQRWWMVAALVVLDVGLAVGPVPGALRPWTWMPVTAWTWLSVTWLLGMSVGVRGTGLAVLALALVVVAHSPLPRVSTAERASTGAAGHILGLASLVAAGSGWGLPAVLGLVTVGFLVSSVLDAVGRSPLVDAVATLVGEPGRYLTPALGAVGIPITAASALDVSGALAWRDPWMVAVPALTGLAYGLAARLVGASPARRTGVWSGFAMTLAAAVLAQTNETAAVACAAVILTVVVVPGADRTALMTWTAWATAVPLVVSLLGVSFDWFDRIAPWQAWSAVLIGVGGAMVLGGTAIDRRGSGWPIRVAPEQAALLPVVVIGAADVVLGELVALGVAGDPGGWLTVAGAAVVLGAALLTRTGILAGAAILLGWFGAVRLAFEQIQESPWISLVVTAALLVAAELLHRTVADRQWWSRWDLAALLGAAPVAATALWSAAGMQAVAGTYLAVGMMCEVVAVRLYRNAAVAASLGLLGTALMFAGATDAGTGWVALLLLVYAVACTAAAAVLPAPSKPVLQMCGAVLAAAAWFTTLEWLAWPDQRSLDVTVAGAAGVVVVSAVAASWQRLEPGWAWAWGGAATVITGAAALVMATSGLVVVTWWAVAGLGAVAVALVVAAAPLATPWLRELSLGYGLGALLVGFDMGDASFATRVAVLVAMAVGLGIVQLGLVRWSVFDEVRRPVLELGAATALLALPFAWAELPERELLVVALAAMAIQAASAGIVVRSVGLQAVAPVLACSSWLVFASEALDRNPQWFTVPMGAALLAVVVLWRHDRRSRSAPVDSSEIVATEMVAVAFLVGSSFVQTFTDSVGYAALAAVIGVLVGGWGLVTRVRRRLAAGGLVTLAGVVLLVMVPLVRLLPAWQGAWLWVIVVAIGLVAIAAASLLETGRELVRTAGRRFVGLTREWE